jgi:hypothetical protein
MANELEIDVNDGDGSPDAVSEWDGTGRRDGIENDEKERTSTVVD